MPSVFFNPTIRGGCNQDYIKSTNNKLEMIEETENYFIYYKPYSKITEKITKRAGNIFVCILKPDKTFGGREHWIQYSDREWPRMKTIPKHIKEKALAFRDFYTLQEKILPRT